MEESKAIMVQATAQELGKEGQLSQESSDGQQETGVKKIAMRNKKLITLLLLKKNV